MECRRHQGGGAVEPRHVHTRPVALAAARDSHRSVLQSGGNRSGRDTGEGEDNEKACGCGEVLMSTMTKTLAVFLLFIGESLAVYAEMVAARLSSLQGTAHHMLLKIIFSMMIAGLALLWGYYLGYKVFQNIWIVTVISITSILIVEPALAYFFFQELQTQHGD